jgi:UDP-N-acetylmuramoyl-L-alanyl-D-glutamate--2,6-diaminopimelate ligase
MRLSELINGIYNKPLPASYRDFEVLTISCDSREEQKDGLFVALPGFKFNGRDFIKDAIDKGAKIIVKQEITFCHPERSEGSHPSRDSSPLGLRMTTDNVCVLDVDDPKYFLYGVGQRFYGSPSDKIKSIGVTGTNGKTTVTYLIESIIHAAARRCGVIGTVNYRIGAKIIPSKNTTPGFLDNQRYLAQLAGLGIDYCVMEASSHALDQGRLEGIHFSAGIFTNLTQDHLDYHISMDNYFKAKTLLFKDLSSEVASVINVDDEYGKRLGPLTKSKIVTYAIDGPADVRAQNITYHLSGSQFEIVFPKGKIRIHTQFIGKYNIYNILAAFAWGISQDLGPEIVRRGIENLTHVPGRLEAVENQNGFFIFIDYAHTEDGLFNVLKSLRAVTPTKIILVFGCGGDRDRTKRPKMARVACSFADHSILTTDNSRSEDPQAIIDEVVTGFTKRNYEICVDRKEAIGRALKMAQKDQIVLIAGKGHEDYQVFKDRTIAFNERGIVKECLQSMKS